MKRFTFTILVACIAAAAAQAQIKQGAYVAGGNIGFAKHKTDYMGSPENISENRGFSVAPLFGKAIRDNLIIGGDVVYNNSYYRLENGTNSYSKTNGNSYGLGGFIRGYRTLGNSGFYLFLQSRLGTGFSENKSYQSNAGNSGTELKNKAKTFHLGLNLYPGVSYAITSRMHIEAGLNDLFYINYAGGNTTYYQQPVPAKDKTNTFNAGMGLGNSTNFSVGVKFFPGS